MGPLTTHSLKHVLQSIAQGGADLCLSSPRRSRFCCAEWRICCLSLKTGEKHTLGHPHGDTPCGLFRSMLAYLSNQRESNSPAQAADPRVNLRGMGK